MSTANPELNTRVMEIEDIEQVLKIEKKSFPIPWSEYAFYCEILENPLADYLVLVDQKESNRILGYAGMWIILDEAHITNIAIDPEHRGQRWGEFLLFSLIDFALKKGVLALTLEVRISNLSALKLYERVGFKKEGLRRAYYEDNNEDAFIMWKRILAESV